MIDFVSNTDIYHISLKTNIYHSTIRAQIFLPIRILKKMNLNISTKINKWKWKPKIVDLQGLLNCRRSEGVHKSLGKGALILSTWESRMPNIAAFRLWKYPFTSSHLLHHTTTTTTTPTNIKSLKVHLATSSRGKERLHRPQLSKSLVGWLDPVDNHI